MKILFVMLNSGATFYYESTLRVLAERGHRIAIAYEWELQIPEQTLAPLCADCPQITGEPLPQGPGTWPRELATRLRTYQDYLRYMEPSYATATYLRRRVEEKVPPALVAVGKAARRAHALPMLQAGLRVVERALPVPDAVKRFVAERAPDVLLVTPLVDIGSKQVDYIKAARALGIPTGACIASWDNLTSKGLMRIVPDRTFVWNDVQRQEAVALHRVPTERVVVTGAQAFDHWFQWTPATTREAFCRAAGLDPDQPYVLFVGSASFAAAEEAAYVKTWISRLRADRADRPELARLGVLVRPHPRQSPAWVDVDLSGTGNTAVQRTRLPSEAESRATYFDTLYHSAAVVGLNTSAMIEAAIVGRPVYTVLAPEFTDRQEGTLHFKYLTAANGGPVHVADGFEQHFSQLADAIRLPDAARASREFVRSFVRPHGLDVPATSFLADAIEALADARPAYARRRADAVQVSPPA